MPREPLVQDTSTRLSSAIFDRLSAAEGSSSLYVLWGFFALASIATAIAVCFTPGAERRFSVAISNPLPSLENSSPAIARVEAVPPAQAPAHQVSQDQILLDRLKALEDQLGGMTGSIARDAPAPLTSAAASAGATPVEETQKAAPAASIPEPAADPEPADSHTTFAVDLGGETSFAALRARWEDLRRKSPDLARLSPRISVRDDKGKFELRLMAGPFDNAADAARACTALIAKGIACDGGIFDGQRLPTS